MTRTLPGTGRHLYAISAQARITLEVSANNRAQARRRAEAAGYEVRDVNLIG